MDKYYVASRIRYAIVIAPDESSAWLAGHESLHRLHSKLLEQSGRDVPVEIETIRLATLEEIANWDWDVEPVSSIGSSTESFHA